MTPRILPQRLTVLTALAAIVLSACSSSVVSTSTSTTSSGTQPPGSGASGLDGVAAQQAVFVVEFGGGFQMVESALREYPSLVIFADGRVVAPGVQPAIFPGPALPSIEQSQIDVVEVASLVDAAASSGLFADGVDFGFPNVADAGTTHVRAFLDGELRSVSVEAMGIGPEGLPAAAVKARADLQELLDLAQQNLAIGGGEAYVPQRWLVYSTPFLPFDGEVAAEPLESPLAMGDFDTLEGVAWCVDLTAAEAAPVIEAASRANEATEWSFDGESRTLLLAPRFDFQPGCG